MVGLGRMQCYGLAANGADGVVRMLEILQDEVRICMGLLGVNALSELNPSYLQVASPSGVSSVLSAFPHLSLDEKAFYYTVKSGCHAVKFGVQPNGHRL